MPNTSNQIYQIKVTLDDTHPPIWRRILVPAHTTLLKLHDILQIMMGWEDYHLHMFTIEGSIYGDPADDEYGDLGTKDEANYKLNKVIYQEGQRLSYEYDFGDSWDHTLLVEKILPPQEGIRYPTCLKGKRACPPEDVGGVWGYENFLEAIRNPDHDEHEEYLTWIGWEFDSEAFDLEEVNTQLRSMGRGRSTEAISPWTMHDIELTGVKFDLDSPWPKTLPEEQRPEFTRLALKHLLAIPSGELASFAQFADQMIEDSRMVWPTENQDNAQRILHSIIERTVINPLVDFGILQTEYEPHKILGAEFRELFTFQITPYGKGLLEAIHSATKPDQP